LTHKDLTNCSEGAQKQYKQEDSIESRINVAAADLLNAWQPGNNVDPIMIVAPELAGIGYLMVHVEVPELLEVRHLVTPSALNSHEALPCLHALHVFNSLGILEKLMVSFQIDRFTGT
jgi:hypothetical protein